MSRDPLMSVSTRATVQTEQAHTDEVRNSAGGFSFEVTPLARATRFLILGTQGGSFYASEKALTDENAKFIISMANGPQAAELLALVCDVSLKGRASKQHATLFTLAVLCASKDEATRADANASIPAICRTPTMLFQFSSYVQNFRGWGRGLRRGIASWYEDKTADSLAYSVTKYRSREGWSHRDLLRLTHPSAPTEQHAAIYDYLCERPVNSKALPEIVTAFTNVQTDADITDMVTLIQRHNLSWEHLPDSALSQVAIWEAMVPNMGITALVRNLGRLSGNGYAKPMSVGEKVIVDRLSDAESIAKSRIHPLQVLTGLYTYKQGRGTKGSLQWTSSPKILDALEEAFYASFGNVVPANKRTLVGVDVSSSMTWGTIAGSPFTPREAAAAMTMVWMRSEPQVFPMAFTNQFTPLPITAKSTLDEVIRTTSGLNFGSTDCSLPMLWALKNVIEVDTFVVLTDSETWAGNMHPFQALKQYRERTGIPARLAVVGMLANRFTIADPNDAGMMDIVGFDTATPNILSEFSAGRL
jgi:60 kDa SS-A/Ro ribonucleoprotein